jgi:MFS family permease
MWSKGFRPFFAAQTISLTGSSLAPVALSLGILNATGRASDLGIVLAAQTLPLLFFLLIGGATADRFPRRAILVMSNLGSGLAQATVAILFLTGQVNVALVAAIGFIGGIFSAFTGPALKGIVPQLVPVADIHRANSVLSSAKNGAKIFGPSVAAVLVVSIGGGGALAVDAASFFVAALLFTGMPSSSKPGATAPGTRPTQRTASLWRDIREGWSTFTGLTWVWVVAVSSALMNLIQPGAWQVLGPKISSERFGDASWGLLLSARGIGLFVFSVVMVKIVARRYLMLGQLLSVLGATPLLVLGLNGSLALALGAAAVAGIGFTASSITLDTSLQEHVPNEMLSRVSSIDDMLSFITVPLGMAFIGPLAEHLGTRATMTLAGVLYAVFAVASLLSRSVRMLPHNVKPAKGEQSDVGMPTR